MVFADGDQVFVALMITPLKQANSVSKSAIFSSVRWEVATGRKLQTVDFVPGVRFRALSRDGRFAVFEGEAGFAVYDLATGAKAFDLEGYAGFIFSEDNTTLVSYHWERLSLRELPSGKEIRREWHSDFRNTNRGIGIDK